MTSHSETINPDAAVLLEDMLRLGRLSRRDFCQRWSIRCLGLLPFPAWAEAVAWVTEQAALKGFALAAYPYPSPPAAPAEKTLSQRAREVMDHAGSLRAGGSLFDQPTTQEHTCLTPPSLN